MFDQDFEYKIDKRETRNINEGDELVFYYDEAV